MTAHTWRQHETALRLFKSFTNDAPLAAIDKADGNLLGHEKKTDAAVYGVGHPIPQLESASIRFAFRCRHGCGMGFARYKNIGAYCAIVMEIELERETGRITVRRVEAAVDAGQPASIDGIRNQVEGGIVQSLS